MWVIQPPCRHRFSHRTQPWPSPCHWQWDGDAAGRCWWCGRHICGRSARTSFLLFIHLERCLKTFVVMTAEASKKCAWLFAQEIKKQLKVCLQASYLDQFCLVNEFLPLAFLLKVTPEVQTGRDCDIVSSISSRFLNVLTSKGSHFWANWPNFIQHK